MSTRSQSITIVAIAGVAVVTAMAGFVVGTRWPIEAITSRFGSGSVASASPWIPFATTDLPRYENLAIQDGRTLFLIGGFDGLDPEYNALATDRLEALDLRTGVFETRSPLPRPLTHAGTTRVRDTIWVVGGFVGDHPGPTTDEVWAYSISTDTWSAGPSLPAARGGGALVALGDTLHSFGGFLPDRNTGSRDHWSLVIGDSIWRSVAEFPHPRGHFTRLRLDGGFLAVGGNIGHDPLPVDVPAVHWFDASRGAWEEGPGLPFSVSHTEPATAPYEGGAVMVGGRSRTSGRENIDDVLFYDPGLERWVHLGRLPVPFLGGTAAVFEDTLVAGLGAEVGNDPRNPQLWKRPLRNQWIRLDSLPLPVRGVGAAALGGTLYAVGDGSHRTLTYSIATGRWSPIDAVDTRPSGGGDAQIESFDGRILVVGGVGWGAGRVQVFDPALAEWRLGPSLPEPVQSVSVAQLGDRLYVMGGHIDGTPAAGVYSMAAGDTAWTTHAPLPLSRTHAAAGSDGRRLFVFGGRDEGGDVTADIQVFDPVEGSWSLGTAESTGSMPEPRAEQGRAVFVEGEFWLIGGVSPEGRSARVDLFDPKAGSWRAGPPLQEARGGIAPVLDGDRILIAGGSLSSGERSSTLEFIWPKR